MTSDAVPQSRIDFIKRWILGTFVGWILALMAIVPGIGIWEIFTSIGWQHQDALWYQIWSDYLVGISFYLVTFVTLILMGMSVGLAQWQIALKGKISKKRWLFSSAFLIITAGVGFLISSRFSPGILSSHRGVASGMDDYYTLRETWLSGVLIRGTIIGALVGLPQWLILRQGFGEASYWLLGTVIGSLITLTAIVAIIAILKSILISMSLGCCISPMIFGAVTGIALFHLLNRSKDTPL